MNEEWKPIVGYEGKYEISNIGRVKCFDYKRTGREQIMKNSKYRNYYKTHLYSNKITTNYIVHRLVAIHFIPNPLNLPCVCHRDETLDEYGCMYNGSDNLWWGTHTDNMQDMYKKGREGKFFKLHHPRNNLGLTGKLSKLSKKVFQYTLDLELVKQWDAIADIKRDLGICASSISDCCLLRKKQYKGFIWSYILLND